MSDSAAAEIRGLARDFAQSHLRPHVEAWDSAGEPAADVLAQVAELGFFGMLVPDTAGGMAFDLPTYAAALEELAWGEAGVAVLVAESAIAADILARSDADRHAALLGDLAGGGIRGCLAISADEPPQVARDGGRRTLRGTSLRVLAAAGAGVVLVRAAVDDVDSLFVLRRTSGYEVGPRGAVQGLRSAGMADVLYDAELTDGHQAGAGATAALAHAAVLGPLSAAAIAVGVSQAALDHAVAYAAEREQFGRAIRSFDGIRHKLAEMATRTAAARALVERAAERGDGVSAAMAKLAAGTCAMFTATEAVQIFGGYGYMRDYPVEKLMRDAKGLEIVHGASELQRLRIAESLYVE